MKQNPSDLVRQCFAAYENKDRSAIEAILADDFTFSSPLDDNIDREHYFARCWPNSEHLAAFNIQKLFAQGNEVFVTYEGERSDGEKFWNTEFFKTEDNKIKHVDVYFGTDEPAEAEEDELRVLIDEIVQAICTKDSVAVMAHYAPDVQAFDLILPLRYTGADQVGERLTEWFSGFDGPMEYNVKDLQITGSADAAFAHFLSHVQGTKMDGQPLSMWWRTTMCFAKKDGKWLITHEHSSVPFDMKTLKASLDAKP